MGGKEATETLEKMKIDQAGRQAGWNDHPNLSSSETDSPCFKATILISSLGSMREMIPPKCAGF